MELKLKIIYSDELGIVTETVDEYGVAFDGEFAYFNNYKVEIKHIHNIILA